MTREWLDTIGTLLGAFATVAGAIIIPIFIFQASNDISKSQLDAQLEAENERSKQSTLQRYFDQMGTLIIDKDLRTTEDSEVRTLARARTATVIQRLDADGNRNVVRFLNEAGLTGSDGSSTSLLAGADLRGAALAGVDLSTMNLSDANLRHANLKKAYFTGADLSNANLSHASLSEADFTGADLNGANLRYATLKGAGLYQANLNDADLSHATMNGNLELASLNGADLYGANLNEADLDGVDLRDSALSGASLSNASLDSAILVDAELSSADLSEAFMGKNVLDGAHARGIFDDDFSDTSSGWETALGSETMPYIIEYQNGSLHVYNAPPSNSLTTRNTSIETTIEDVNIEVDATLTADVPQNRESSWGIVCRADEQRNNLFELGINSDGSSAIWRLRNNHWEELATEEPTDVVRSGDATNHLRADCSGSTLALYANGRKLLDVDHVSGVDSGKQTGLYVEDPGNGEAIDVLFDNFVVQGPVAEGLP